jgi:hypothetical protein
VPPTIAPKSVDFELDEFDVLEGLEGLDAGVTSEESGLTLVAKIWD